jgi:hypothetical protein
MSHLTAQSSSEFSFKYICARLNKNNPAAKKTIERAIRNANDSEGNYSCSYNQYVDKETKNAAWYSVADGSFFGIIEDMEKGNCNSMFTPQQINGFIRAYNNAAAMAYGMIKARGLK